MVNSISIDTIKDIFNGGSKDDNFYDLIKIVSLTYTTYGLPTDVVELIIDKIRAAILTSFHFIPGYTLKNGEIIGRETENSMVYRLKKYRHIFRWFFSVHSKIGIEYQYLLIDKIIESHITEASISLNGIVKYIISKIKEIDSVINEPTDEKIIEWLNLYQNKKSSDKVYAALIILAYGYEATKEIWDAVMCIYISSSDMKIPYRYSYRIFICDCVVGNLQTQERFIIDEVDKVDDKHKNAITLLWLKYHEYILYTIDMDRLTYIISNPNDYSYRVYETAVRFYIERSLYYAAPITLSRLHELTNSGNLRLLSFVAPCCEFIKNKEFTYSTLYYNMIYTGIIDTVKENYEHALRRFVNDHSAIMHHLFTKELMGMLVTCHLNEVVKYINRNYPTQNDNEIIRNKIIVKILTSIFNHDGAYDQGAEMAKILESENIKILPIDTVGLQIRTGVVLVASKYFFVEIPRDAQVRKCDTRLGTGRCNKIKILGFTGTSFTKEKLARFDDDTYVHVDDVLKADIFDMSNISMPMSNQLGFIFTTVSELSKFCAV